MKNKILLSLFLLPIMALSTPKDTTKSGVSINVKGKIGVDFIRNQFTPAFDLHLGVKINQYHINLGSSTNFFFDNITKNKPSLYNFIRLEGITTDPADDGFPLVGGGIAVLADPWFTSTWEGKQFERKTWKLYTYVRLKHIDISPELIFSGIYCYPGISVKFQFSE